MGGIVLELMVYLTGLVIPILCAGAAVVTFSCYFFPFGLAGC